MKVGYCGYQNTIDESNVQLYGNLGLLLGMLKNGFIWNLFSMAVCKIILLIVIPASHGVNNFSAGVSESGYLSCTIILNH